MDGNPKLFRLRFEHGSRSLSGLLAGVLLSLISFVAANDLEFSVTTWLVRDGLPQDTVRVMIQTRDRYLWIATPNGLARFDGSRFVVFEAATTENLPNNLVTAMCEDDQGNLWLGLESGQLVRYRNGRFSLVPVAKGWPRTSVDRIVDGDNGRIWVLSHNGVVMQVLDSGASLLPSANSGKQIINLIKDKDGPVWVQQGSEFRLIGSGGGEDSSDGAPAAEAPAIAFAAQAGGIWILDRFRLRRWRAGAWVEDRGKSPSTFSKIPIATECRDGTILAGSFRRGMYLVSKTGETNRIGKEHGLGVDWVNCVLEDDEGGKWAGTSGGGLSRIRNGCFSLLPVPGWMSNRAILSVSTGSNDDIWIGSEGEGVLRYGNKEWKRWSKPEGLARTSVRSVLCDRNGVVWAGTWGGGVYTMVGNRFSPAPGWTRHLDDVMCLYEDPHGTLYAGTRVGLLKKTGDEWSFVRCQEGELLGDIRSIAVDGNEVLWVGTAGAGLWSLKQGVRTRYGRTSGLKTDNVWAILPDGDDPDALWLGTQGGGLSLVLKGAVHTFTKVNGIPGNTISGLSGDVQGRLWLVTEEGIACILKDDIRRFIRGEVLQIPTRFFDQSDGLISQNFASGTQPTVGRARDGTLWYATATGVAGLDPDAAFSRLVLPSPPVILERVIADDRVQEIPEDRTEMRIHPGVQRLEIQFGAVSFTSPSRVRFLYRLVGLDDNWVAAESRRMVHYSHLPPGSYVFEVKASNGSDNWGAVPTQFSFTIDPFIWQVRWVQLLAGAVGVSSVVTLSYQIARARQRRKLAALRQQHLLLRERERISRDIHDDLGANLTRISMLSDMTMTDPKLSSDTGLMVGNIAECARKSVTSLDEIVWAINPRHDTLGGLFDYLSHYCHDYLEETDVSLKLELPDEFPTIGISSETRYGILMLVKESLNNVVKHAGPCLVRLAVSVSDGWLCVLVEDNGRGFDQSRRPATANGLASMDERGRKLSGRIELRSEPGVGTRISFEIPLSQPNASTHDFSH